MPLFQRVIDIFDSGLLGRAKSAHITRLGWLGDPKARYRLRKELTGGVLYDLSVHQIDLLHRLLGPAASILRRVAGASSTRTPTCIRPSPV